MSVKPKNYGAFVRFSVAVYDALGKRGWERLPTIGSPLGPTRRVLIESFPRSAWRSLCIPPLPAKAKTQPVDLDSRLAALRELFQLRVPGTPTHDQLQALVSGLAGLALESNNWEACAAAGFPPILEDGYWREGYIVNPVRSNTRQASSNEALQTAAKSTPRQARNYLAVDLGAESGRAIAGTLAGGTLTLEELHRFPNIPVRVFSALYWDTLRLWHEIQQGIAIATRGRELDGIAVDTWGVDFALLGEDGALIDNPRHYRDPRNHGIVDKMFARVPREEIFQQAGVQFMEINTLCQLYAMKLAGSPALDRARTLLMMPDLFNYWLTGIARSELTIASTSQFCDPRTGRWATKLFGQMGLPESILPEIIRPGERLGEWRNIPVFTAGSHDTASAVAAIPAESRDWCYISSGTWSLMGVELDAPVINEMSLALNLTNERGFGGTTRLLKNIAGLWLVQECRRAWSAAGTDFLYEDLTRMAAVAQPFVARIDPDAFPDPGGMPAKIQAWCAASGQRVPETPGEITRTILESLAFRYLDVLESLERLLGRRLGTIHIVGGGSRNKFLNRLVADITGRRVVAGPAEATAAGNILIQAIASGQVANLAEAREVVRRSFPVEVFLPRDAS